MAVDIPDFQIIGKSDTVPCEPHSPANWDDKNGDVLQNNFEPIAIIGMGMRLPGGVHDSSSYWDLLVHGKTGLCPVPKSRYNIDAWYGPDKKSHVSSKVGYFLNDLNIAHIDPSFWSFGKQEAELMDPQQRLLLEVVYEAFESAGATGWRGKDIGVYVGTMGDDWKEMELRDEQHLYPVRADVFGDYILANRTSYEFDLRGPSLVVRTACSSSLVALHMACQDLHSHTCTAAIVAGANIILSPRSTVVMTEQGVLSSAGSCKSFDAEADGYVRGEGVSALYIKRLSDAIRDEDPIRAVIRSTCVGSDGKTSGMTVPSPESHERLMRMAYRIAGIEDHSKTAMVECHGTGTVVGDPLEVQAVANIWGQHGIYIGSVKPNIGHGEGSSGISSIMKMVLALENSTIPPNINFKIPNPKIPWKEAKLTVPTKPLPWPEDRLERVSVNSFGIGGTNAHVLLESASCFGVPPVNKANQRSVDKATQPHLLVFSAQHPKALERTAIDIENYSTKSVGRLRDLAYTLGAKRSVHSYRAFCVADSQTPFQLSPTAKAGVVPPSLIWVFTGQGAQWAQMGKELLENCVVVQCRIDSLDRILANLPDRPSWTLRAEILAAQDKSRLYEAEFSQPCLAAIQISLVDLLRSWNITPSAVVGHSSGETAAAYASGAITAEEAFLLAYHRGKITPILKAAHSGGMAAVGLGRNQVEKYLRPGVVIGCENSSSSVTLSGDKQSLNSVMDDIRLHHPEVLVRGLQVECGYHSPHMQTVKPHYESRIAGIINAKKPDIPFYSSVTCEINKDMSSSYWVLNLVSPVLFDTAVREVLANFQSPTFVEIGPHSALAGPIRQILKSETKTAQYIPTLVRNEDGLACLLKTAGQLWLGGHDINIASVNPKGNLLVDLPNYPWHYDGEYWVESRMSSAWRFRNFDHHELLGTRVLESSDAGLAWRCNLRAGDVPWLQDHEIGGDILLPWSGYISMVAEALWQLSGRAEYSFRRINFLKPLVLIGEPVEIVTTLGPSDLNDTDVKSLWYNFSISSEIDGVWRRHASGQCRAGAGIAVSIPQVPSLPRTVAISSFYDMLKNHGICYGPAFRKLSGIRSDVSKKLATGTVFESSEQTPGYGIHPTIMDSSLHIAMVAGCHGLERNFDTVSVPIYIDAMYLRNSNGPIHVTGEVFEGNAGNGNMASNVTGVCNGAPVLHLEGLKISPISSGSPSWNHDHHAAAVLEWKPDVDFVDAARFQKSTEFINLLGNKNPAMRVLEVGMETSHEYGSTLPSLQAAHGERMYGKYTYTCRSLDSLSPVKEQLKGFQGVEYAVFDISKSPVSQGLNKGDFDLVIISDPVTPAKDVSQILQNAGQLLLSGGHLIIHRLGSVTKEMFPGPGNPSRQLEDEEAWRENLRGAGFNGTGAIFLDDDGGSLVAQLQKQVIATTKFNVLCRDSTHPVLSEAIGLLSNRGFEFELYTIGQDLLTTRHTLCLLDLESPYLYNMEAAEYAAFKKSLLSVQDSGMLWVTGASQIDCTDPNYSLILGVARTIRRENSVDLVTLELESFNEQGWGAVADVLSTFAHRKSFSEVDVNPDSEYVLHDGAIKIARFHWINISEELLQVGDETSPKQLVAGMPGSIESLHWVETEPIAMSRDYLEVDVKAVAVGGENTNQFTSSALKTKELLALEGAGIIRTTGPDVQNMRVGDRVVFNSKGQLTTSVTLPETAYVNIPDDIDDARAASIAADYGAAAYAVMEVAKIKKDESVFIHGGHTSVGFALIQLAKMMKAEVYCTAQSEDDFNYIETTTGIPRNHMFGEAEASFPSSLLDATGGHGADIVLHASPARDSLRACWSCVARYGTLVQIGKPQGSHNLSVDIDLFEGNRTFSTIDFKELSLHSPGIWKSVLTRVFGYFNQRLLQPVLPTRTFDAAHVAEAVQYVQKFQNMNKAIVTMPENTTHLKALPARLETRLRPDRAYLIVGGFGGLGQSTARFLAEKGARHLILFSRSAAAFAHSNPDVMREFDAMNCDVKVISGSVSDLADLKKMVTSSKLPIAGVLNSAAVLEDVNFSQMTFSQWQTAISPKVHGTWNLHQALQAQPDPLDFFFLFSSLSGLGGLVGQANYAAANTFLDAFVQYRHSLGLHCSVLDIGAVHGIGILAHHSHRLGAMRAENLHRLREQDVLDALELMIQPTPVQTGGEHGVTAGYVSHRQVAVGLGGEGKGITSWSRDPRTIFRKAVEGPGHTKAPGVDDTTLKGLISRCSSNPRLLEMDETVVFFAREIGTVLLGFLMRGDEKVDLSASLESVGADSLVSMELRNWFRLQVGLVLTVTEILEARSLMELGRLMVQKVSEKHRRDARLDVI